MWNIQILSNRYSMLNLKKIELHQQFFSRFVCGTKTFWTQAVWTQATLDLESELEQISLIQIDREI